MHSRWRFYGFVLAVVLLAGLLESAYSILSYDDFRYNYLKAQLPRSPKLVALCGPDISIARFPSHRIYLDSAIYNTSAKGSRAEAYVKAKFIRQDSRWLLQSTAISSQ
jgi:hypothetical protein